MPNACVQIEDRVLVASGLHVNASTHVENVGRIAASLSQKSTRFPRIDSTTFSRVSTPQIRKLTGVADNLSAQSTRPITTTMSCI